MLLYQALNQWSGDELFERKKKFTSGKIVQSLYAYNSNP